MFSTIWDIIHFYEPLMQFMVGQNSNPRIFHEDHSEKLLFGHRTHEAPEKAE